MNKSVWTLCFLAAGAWLARGQTTDDYYSVQNGYWTQATTWTSPAPTAFGYPRTGDVAYVYHEIAVTDQVACAGARVEGRIDVAETGYLTIHDWARLDGAQIDGPGGVTTLGDAVLTGTPSRIGCPWDNAGRATCVNAQMLLENRFFNRAGATVEVNSAAFAISGTSGVGVVENQGTWRVGAGATCEVAHFNSQTGTMFLGTGSLFRTAAYGQFKDGTWYLDSESVFEPVREGGTADFDGELVSSGPGQWQINGGTAWCSRLTSTTTTFNIAGGYYWRAGEIDVPPGNEAVNQGEFHVPGNAATQHLSGTFVNEGNLWLGSRTSTSAYFHFDVTLRNGYRGTSTVESSDFHWRGTGTFENAGTFRVADGVTGSTETVRFSLRNGLVWLGPGAGYQILGNKQQHTGGSFELATGSVCQLVCGGTDYWDGVFVATGDGKLRMEGGTLMASYDSATTTIFSADGGGFEVTGGTLNVRPNTWLENRGTLIWAATSAPAVVQGNFRNSGLTKLGAASPVSVVTYGERIENTATSIWSFTESGGSIGSGAAQFHNYGQVSCQAQTAIVDMAYFNNLGATTVVTSGTASFPKGLVAGGGRVQLGGGILHAINGLYLWGPEAVVQGIGLIAGYIDQTQGTLAPGHSPGALSIGDYYAQGTNAVLQIEIGGKNPGTEYDQLAVAGNASVKGTLNVELYGGYVPAAGRRFDILTAAACPNAFMATNLPALPPGTDWLLLYRTNGVQLRVVSPTDADGDGLQDDWETTHFGDTTSRDGGDEDFDGDGYTDYIEQCLDTQPTNNADFLQVADITTSGSNSLVELRTGSLVQYAIEARPDLSDPVGQWSVVDEFAGTGGTVVRTNAASGALRFYRLEATVP